MYRKSLLVLACALYAAAPALGAGPVYTYDNLGRLQTATYGNGLQIFYYYDPAGNRTQVATQTGTNAPPQANNDYIAVVKNNATDPFDPTTNDTDPNGNTLTVTALGTPSHGSATRSGNQVTYTPDHNYTGPDSFTYTISDGHGLSASATIYATIAPGPPPPVAVNDVASTPANTPKQFDPRTNDTPNNVPITANSTPSHGTANHTSTQLTYTPTAGYAGSDKFTYTITDAYGQASTAKVSVSVGAPPVAVSDYVPAPTHTPVTFDPRVNDLDPNGFPLTVAGVSTPTAHNGTAVNNGGLSITYTSATGYSGPDSFTYTLSDGQLTATATEYMCVGGVLPVAATDSLIAVGHSSPGNPVQGIGQTNVLANDTDACLQNLGLLTVISATNGTLGSTQVQPDGKTIVYFTNNAYESFHRPDSFTYTVSDPFGGTATGTVNVDIQIDGQ